MPVCCIIQCGAKKNKNLLQLTLHRFPKKEGLRLKWLRAIGEKNINPRHKEWYLCSLHFEESCFNRTLDVIRLRDGSVPSIFPVSAPKAPVLCETSSIMTDVANTSTILSPLPKVHPSVKILHKKVILDQKMKALEEKCIKHKKKIKCLNEKLQRKNKKIVNLNNIIKDLQQKKTYKF